MTLTFDAGTDYPRSISRLQFGTLLSNGQVNYVADGNVVNFNPNNKTFTTPVRFPGSRSIFLPIKLINDNIVFKDRDGTVHSLYIFNPTSQKFSDKISLPRGERDIIWPILLSNGNVVYSSVVFSIGDSAKNNYIFNPTLQRFSSPISWPNNERQLIDPILVGDKILYSGVTTNKIYEFDTTNNSFNSGVDFPTGRSLSAPILLPNGTVLYSQSDTNNVIIYNPTDKTTDIIGLPAGGVLAPNLIRSIIKSNGDIYFYDHNNDFVYRFISSLNRFDQHRVESPGQSPSPLSTPVLVSDAVIVYRGRGKYHLFDTRINEFVSEVNAPVAGSSTHPSPVQAINNTILIRDNINDKLYTLTVEIPPPPGTKYNRKIVNNKVYGNWRMNNRGFTERIRRESE